MKIINKIYEELKRSPTMMLISIFGIIIAILGMIIPIYFAVREDTAISLEVIYKSDVLNLQKDIKDLEIQFRDTDMIKEGLILTSLYIKIANIGDKDITKKDFDTDIPWKLKIIDGEILKVTSFADDSYLKKQLEKINIFKGFVELPFFIFDKNKYFILNTLVLHKKNTPIKLVMDGKISGMDKFTYAPEITNFLRVAFQGGILTQLVRLIVYFLISCIYLTGFVLLYKLLYELLHE